MKFFNLLHYRTLLNDFKELPKNFIVMILMVDCIIFLFTFLVLGNSTGSITIYKLLKSFGISFIPIVFFSYTLFRKKWWIYNILIVFLVVLTIIQVIGLMSPSRSRFSVYLFIILILTGITFVYFTNKEISLLFERKTLITQKQSMEYLKLATPFSRLLAVIIDILISMIPTFSIMLFVFFTISYYVGFNSISAFKSLLMIFIIVFYIAYGIIQIVLMVTRSQTIGKYLMNIYVVDIDKKKRIGFWKYIFVREIFGKTLIIGLLAGLSQISESIAFISAFIWIPYFIIDNLLIFRKNHMTIHDEIAGTKVFYVGDKKS